MNKPKVVRVISYLTVGGVEKRLLAVLKELRGEFDCEVVCIHSRGPLAEQFENAGIPVTLIPFKGRFHPLSLLKLALFLRKKGAKIVHSHMYRPNASATVAALLGQVPVIIANIHNLQHWDSSRQRLTDAFLHPFRTHTITVSREVWREYLEETGADPQRVSVLRNGVLLSGPQGDSEDLFEELRIPHGAQVVSCVARLVPQKGHGVLLRAWRGIEARFDNAWLLLVGGGPLEDELKGRAESLGLKRVLFTGVRDDVPSILQSSSCMVLSSFKEGFSNAILEAMAVGTPVVATRVGGAEEAMEDGITGLLVPPEDTHSLTRSIIGVLTNPRFRKRLGLQAKERQMRLFSLRSMAAKTAALYRSLLER